MRNWVSGSCHCNTVKFKVKSDVESTFNCNCSFCVRRNATLTKIGVDNFELISEKEGLSAYGNSGFSKHYFCKRCGIQCFSEVEGSEAKSIIVNVGCLEGIDVYSLKPTLFDGANKL